MRSYWNTRKHRCFKISILGTFALQHRGQEASGLVTIDRSSESESISSHKDYGLVSDVFDGFDFDNLKGDLAVGHVRYSTQGGRSLQNIQPFLFRSARFWTNSNCPQW